MTREELQEIFELEEYEWEGDNALKGLQILAKYKDIVLIGAGYEVIYSLRISEVLELGLTKEDADALRRLNWMLDSERDCLACFV